MIDLDDRDDILPRPARPRKTAVIAIGAILIVILAGGGLLLHSALDTDPPDLTVPKDLATIGADPPPAIADPGDRSSYFAKPSEPPPAEPPPAPVPLLAPLPAEPAPFVPPAAWKAPITLMPAAPTSPADAMAPGYPQLGSTSGLSTATNHPAALPVRQFSNLPQESAIQSSSERAPLAGYDPAQFAPAAATDRASHAAALASLARREPQAPGAGAGAGVPASPFAQADSAALYGSKAVIVQASQDAPRNVSRLRTPTSGRTLSPGTIVQAVLTTGVNSDLPGSFNARVTRTVWDEIDGDVPLIPQGSLITGTVASQVEYGEERAFLVAKYIRLAGTNAYLDVGGVSASALDGTAGVPAEVNNHYGRTIGVGILTAVLGAGSAVARAGIDDDRNSIQSESIASGATELQRVGGQFLQRELRIRPTLTAKPGDQFSFILNRELAFGEAP